MLLEKIIYRVISAPHKKTEPINFFYYFYKNKAKYMGSVFFFVFFVFGHPVEELLCTFSWEVKRLPKVDLVLL